MLFDNKISPKDGFVSRKFKSILIQNQDCGIDFVSASGADSLKAILALYQYIIVHVQPKEEYMLDFSLSEEQQITKDSVARLVKNIVVDKAHDMDETGSIPDKYIQSAWELGISMSMVPEEYGGYEMDYSPMINAIVLEELAYGDMAFAIAATLPSMFIYPLNEMGTIEQKKKYLPMYCKESYTPCSFAVNEPHFGFDLTNMKTGATKNGGNFILNGEKCFVPLAAQSAHIMVAASYDGTNSIFIVDRDNPGLTISEQERNLGLYALQTYEITLTDCEIPDHDRLGGESGCDFDKIIQKTAIAMSAIGTGVGRASFEYARDYAKERVQFGEPIAHKQAIAFLIAEMAYEVDAMRLMTWKAASRLEAGKDIKRESYLAKLFAGETAMKITDHGVQILGGHGYIREHPVERYYRNARGISILNAMAIV
jgi:acyl-CoA dehydrogenase